MMLNFAHNQRCNKKYTETILAHFSDYQKYKRLTIHSLVALGKQVLM